MLQDNSSFPVDIKTLEERLANEPHSLCFARLAAEYLSGGLVDDALRVARQGVAIHPRFLSGQRALAMACRANGLNDECITALRQVTDGIPEDTPSQKLLGCLLIETGDLEAAQNVFRIAREFAPDDPECFFEANVSAITTETAPETFDDDEILEDLEIYEELEVIDDDEPAEDVSISPEIAAAVVTSTTQQDPLYTPTMAELYVTQGFISKAREIYCAILTDDPANAAVSLRITELDLLEPGSECPTVTHTAGTSQNVDLPASSGKSDLQVLTALEGWLDNIGRIKACR